MLSDSIPTVEDFEYLSRINNTDFDYLEPHYFDPNHEYRFIGYKDEIEREYLNWERNGLTEL